MIYSSTRLYFQHPLRRTALDKLNRYLIVEGCKKKKAIGTWNRTIYLYHLLISSLPFSAQWGSGPGTTEQCLKLQQSKYHQHNTLQAPASLMVIREGNTGRTKAQKQESVQAFTYPLLHLCPAFLLQSRTQSSLKTKKSAVI